MDDIIFRGYYRCTYNLFIHESYVESDIELRKKAIIDELDKHNLNGAQVVVLDANLIKDWVNCYPSVIKYVCLQLRINPLEDFSLLEDVLRQKNYSREFFNTSALNIKSQQVISHLESTSKNTIRILGKSGLGKTHFVINAILSKPLLKTSALYLDLFNYNDISKINALINGFSNSQCILVIDNCSLDWHKQLNNIASKNQGIKLITIDNDISNLQINNTLLVHLASDEQYEIVKAILDPILTKHNSRHHLDKLVSFCGGYPLLAKLIIDSIEKNGLENVDIGQLLDSDDINKLLFGKTLENEKEQAVIAMFSFFDTVRCKHKMIKLDELSDNEICMIENQRDFLFWFFLRHKGINEEEYRVICNRLIDKAILDARGTLIRIKPLPLSVSLLKQSLNEATFDFDTVIRPVLIILSRSKLDSLRELSVSLITQIRNSMLSGHMQIIDCINDNWGEESPFSKAENLLTSWGSYVLRNIVDIAPEMSVQILGNVLKDFTTENLLEIHGSIRRNIIFLLEKLCLYEATFEMAAKLMLRFALAENEHWVNNSKGLFVNLFQLYLPGTEANYAARLKVLAWVVNNYRPQADNIIIKAIAQAFHIGQFFRMSNARSQSITELTDYQPRTNEEVSAYWDELLKYLLIMIDESTEVNQIYNIFYDIILTALLRAKRINDVEIMINKFKSNHNLEKPLVGLINSLRRIKQFDKDVDSECIDGLLIKLEPLGLTEKLRLNIIGKVYAFGDGGEIEQQSKELRLAEELITTKENDAAINLLVDSDSYNTLDFGIKIATKDCQFAKNIINNIQCKLLQGDNIEHCYFLVGLLHGINDINLFKEFVNVVITKTNQYKLAFDITSMYRFDLSDFMVLARIKEDNHLPDEYFTKLGFQHLSLEDKLVIVDYFWGLNDLGKSKSLEIIAFNLNKPDAESVWLEKMWDLIQNTNVFLIKFGNHLDYQLYTIMDGLLKKGDIYAEKIACDLYEYCLVNKSGYPTTYYWNNLFSTLLDNYYEIIWDKYLGNLFLEDWLGEFFVVHLLSSRKLYAICNTLDKIQKMLNWCKKYEDKQAHVRLARNILLLKNNKPDSTSSMLPEAIIPDLTIGTHELPEKWTDAILELLKVYDDDAFLDAISTNLNEYSLAGERVSSYYSRCSVQLGLLVGSFSEKVDAWLSKTITNFKSMASIEARRESELSALHTLYS